MNVVSIEAMGYDDEAAQRLLQRAVEVYDAIERTVASENVVNLPMQLRAALEGLDV